QQINLCELGVHGQNKLKAASVVVIGAGGLGCPVLQYLTAAGVGKIGIVDGDRVERSNLHRQILYGSDDIGKWKVEAAARKLTQLNPNVQIYPLPIKLNEQNA